MSSGLRVTTQSGDLGEIEVELRREDGRKEEKVSFLPRLKRADTYGAPSP